MKEWTNGGTDDGFASHDHPATRPSCQFSAAHLWDYLIVTASNERQAEEYKSQMLLREKLGLGGGVRQILVVPDPGGKRVGSGGSTVHCLLTVLNRELTDDPTPSDPERWRDILRGLRILIVHAGGDAKRLPPYSPCGKLFIPLPGENDSPLELTLIDRQLPDYLRLPPPPGHPGQIVITSGDVLLSFDASGIVFSATGVTGIGCYAEPELVQHHGAYCADSDGTVRFFLQKPRVEEQHKRRAVSSYGQSILDIGILNLGADSAVALLELFEVTPADDGQLAWSGEMGEVVKTQGLDFYREFCCAMGTEATFKDYQNSVVASGSKVDSSVLKRLFDRLSQIPFNVQRVPRCLFLHFGTLMQLISSGNDLSSMDLGISRPNAWLNINNQIEPDGEISGRNAWIEGCRISSRLTLGGDNVVVGLDITEPLTLPAKACMDVLAGRDRTGRPVMFVRCFGISDLFNHPELEQSTICNRPVLTWLDELGAAADEIWDAPIPVSERTLWNARLFPAETLPEGYLKWLFLFDLPEATAEQKVAWKEADRYSLAELTLQVSQPEFRMRRIRIRAENIRRNLGKAFRMDSAFSARELKFIFDHLNESDRVSWLADLLHNAHKYYRALGHAPRAEQLELARFLHTLGSVLLGQGDSDADLIPEVRSRLSTHEIDWLESLAIDFEGGAPSTWGKRAQDAAFRLLGKTIVLSRHHAENYPKNSLRSDEIIWSRAPARIDLGGGWTDTPPYTLERGGCVINAAVDLNGQAPIQVYARVLEEREIRINSIDHSVREVITTLDDLQNYNEPTSRFGLAKASLTLSGFSPDMAAWPEGTTTLEQMLECFGGGIELTTMAAIPSGSGLGTSSIMGAVLMSALHRLIGRPLALRELFHKVLQLEQELTTGGGWQDQIGGALEGVKMITAEAGLVPDPQIHFVTPDLLDPHLNGGVTLLFYTGLRRLAKNILRDVVEQYLDRDRGAMDTLRRIHAFPPAMVEAMSRKDEMRFGQLIDYAWNLNKALDPDSTTEDIETILDLIAPHIRGAKLLGAGGGGFLLIVAKSPSDADQVRMLLTEQPPNERARFFDFNISTEGLVTTVC